MNQGELPIGRLASLWFPGSIDVIELREPAAPPSAPSTWAAAFKPAAAREEQPARAATCTPRVLVTRGPARLPALFECELLASGLTESRAYRIEPFLSASIEKLEQHCQLQVPRIVVIDTGMVRRAGPEALRHVRRRLPATDWLLASDHAAAEHIDLPILKQTRGLIGWDVSEHQLTAALDAVLSGKLWFPRTVLESLYLSLLGTDEPGRSAAPAESCADTLSSREAEVFALMRHGMTNRQIAERLGISANTVKKHIANVFEKRGLHGRRQALG